jgi:hypothetical protein
MKPKACNYHALDLRERTSTTCSKNSH